MSNSCIEINKGGNLRFDTYFNLFNFEKWFKYTNVKSVKLLVKVKGSVRINYFRKEFISKGGYGVTEQFGEDTLD